MRCLNCGREVDLIEDKKEGALHRILSLSGAFGPNACDLVFEYALLRLGGRSIKNQELKLVRILEDLFRLWKDKKFQYQKRAWQISHNGILTALKTVCNKRFSAALENNNYLKKVMISIAEEEARERSIGQEKALIRRERDQRGSGLRPGENFQEEEPLDSKIVVKLAREYLRGKTPGE